RAVGVRAHLSILDAYAIHAQLQLQHSVQSVQSHLMVPIMLCAGYDTRKMRWAARRRSYARSIQKGAPPETRTTKRI
ncbi:hypothetical protein THAOC_21173, partial [Thalassiosira oceanica]